MARQTKGPYRVMNDGTYRIVFNLNETGSRYREVDDKKIYTKRQAAFRRCKQLNDRYAEEHMMDETDETRE